MHGEEEIKLLYTTVTSSDVADAGKRLKDDDPSCRAHGSSDFQDGLARGEKKKTVGFLIGRFILKFFFESFPGIMSFLQLSGLRLSGRISA